MKQTKKKSEKEQPINVQLTEDDLTELLVVIKDFMSEEISDRNKRIFLNQSEMHSRIISLEGKERRRESKELKQIPSCPHKISAFQSVQYIGKTSALSSVTYKCESCGLEELKIPCFLTRKEKKALKNLGVRV